MLVAVGIHRLSVSAVVELAFHADCAGIQLLDLTLPAPGNSFLHAQRTHVR